MNRLLLLHFSLFIGCCTQTHANIYDDYKRIHYKSAGRQAMALAHLYHEARSSRTIQLKIAHDRTFAVGPKKTPVNIQKSILKKIAGLTSHNPAQKDTAPIYLQEEFVACNAPGVVASTIPSPVTKLSRTVQKTQKKLAQANAKIASLEHDLALARTGLRVVEINRNAQCDRALRAEQALAAAQEQLHLLHAIPTSASDHVVQVPMSSEHATHEAIGHEEAHAHDAQPPANPLEDQVQTQQEELAQAHANEQALAEQLAQEQHARETAEQIADEANHILQAANGIGASMQAVWQAFSNSTECNRVALHFLTKGAVPLAPAQLPEFPAHFDNTEEVQGFIQAIATHNTANTTVFENVFERLQHEDQLHTDPEHTAEEAFLHMAHSAGHAVATAARRIGGLFGWHPQEPANPPAATELASAAAAENDQDDQEEPHDGLFGDDNTQESAPAPATADELHAGPAAGNAHPIATALPTAPTHTAPRATAADAGAGAFPRINPTT